VSDLEPTGTRATNRRIFLAISAVAVVVVLIAAHAVLLPFVLAMVVAYLLTPAVTRVERARVPRWAAILLVYFVTLGVIGGSVAVIVPRLVAEGQALGAEAPNLAQRLRDEVLPGVDARLSRWSGQKLPQGEAEIPPPPEAAVEERGAPLRVITRPDGSMDITIRKGIQIREAREGVWQLEEVEEKHGISSFAVLREGLDKGIAYLRENSLELVKIGQAVVASISRGIFNLFMTLMLGGYMILTREKILAFFRDLWVPSSRDSFDRFLRRLDRGLSGVVRGQLIICLVNGVLSAIGFWLFDLKYWPILAIVAAVMSLIPIFGSILSSVPAVAIGLTQSPGTAFGVLAWIVGIHQLEANFLNPKIIGDSAKIHPVLVVFSLLVGEHFFQISGALLAVPCMSIAQTIFLHFRESTLGLADPMDSVPPPARLSGKPGSITTPRPPATLDVIARAAEVDPDSPRAGGSGSAAE
jgi:predicted PurR-regulated permease PerM